MKTLTFFFLFTVSITALAQTEPLPSEFTFTDIVAADSLSKDELWKNAKIWITEASDIRTILRDSLAGKISGEAGFMAYAQTGVLQKVSGRISYSYQVFVKDNKYRYVFDNFIFYYYHQDRNYKMVESGKTRSLNERKASGWQKLWDQHRKNTKAKIATAIVDLNVKLTFKPKKEKAKEKKVEW